MAHKTLIGGTAYEISGGKTLINGTAYSIDKGKTLVGGTAYEVGFVKEFVPLYDFGTLSDLTTTIGGKYKTHYGVSLPFDVTEATHLIVNGEIFECTGWVSASDSNGNMNSYSYKLAGDTGIFASADFPYRIKFDVKDGGKWDATFTAYAIGTYTVSIGKYA